MNVVLRCATPLLFTAIIFSSALGQVRKGNGAEPAADDGLRSGHADRPDQGLEGL